VDVNETVPREQWVWWDMGFLAIGVLLAVIGWILLRRGGTREVAWQERSQSVADPTASRNTHSGL
jgi:hypothetical protein